MHSGPANGARRFPRSNRLTDSRAFSRVFAGAERVADRHFTLLYRHRDTGSGARLGMAVSRRSAPRAVDRNRIKRMLRETFRHVRGELPDVDLVIIARGAAREASAARLRRSAERLFERMQRQCARL